LPKGRAESTGRRVKEHSRGATAEKLSGERGEEVHSLGGRPFVISFSKTMNKDGRAAFARSEKNRELDARDGRKPPNHWERLLRRNISSRRETGIPAGIPQQTIWGGKYPEPTTGRVTWFKPRLLAKSVLEKKREAIRKEEWE